MRLTIKSILLAFLLMLFKQVKSQDIKMDDKMENDKIELIVVFKKGIELQNAQTILDKAKVKYRKGMDSSRGKIYFYETGPKFILTFESEREKKKFISEYQDIPEIYEIYTPDWKIQKD